MSMGKARRPHIIQSVRPPELFGARQFQELQWRLF
jgi:hypothetical protein